MNRRAFLSRLAVAVAGVPLIRRFVPTDNYAPPGMDRAATVTIRNLSDHPITIGHVAVPLDSRNRIYFLHNDGVWMSDAAHPTPTRISNT